MIDKTNKKKTAAEKDKEFWQAVFGVKKVVQKKAPKKEPITEFESMDDWMLSMILVGLMHANPGMSPEKAIEAGREWVRKLYMPKMSHLWRKQAVRIDRFGLRAEASKIRREMFKLI